MNDDLSSDGRGKHKRPRRENGSQTDEDLLLSDGHCCEAAHNMAEINSKLDKLLNVLAEFETIKVRLAQVEDENKQLKQSAENAERDISNLKTTTVYTCTNMDANNQELKSLKDEVDNLKRRNIKLEAYTRRENIKVFGIEEFAGETNADTEKLLRTMMHEKMKIPRDDVEDIRFERVHRLPTRKDRTPSSKPKAIIAKFSFYQDKEYMWSFVKNLKGTGIGIANDFPREIDKIHEKLYPVLKEAKKAKQNAYFKVDKLIINGQVYRGKETDDLDHYGLIMNSNSADRGL